MKPFNFIPISLAAAIALTSFPGSARAQTFEPPSDPSPGNTTGGASRTGSCFSGGSLMPLAPNADRYFTAAERPTLFVYVPELGAGTSQLFFSIQDEMANQVYETVVPIESGDRVVPLSVPDDAPALEAGRTYRWFASAMCHGELDPDSPVVAALIERLDEGVASSPTDTPTLAEIERLRSAGAWYDAVSAAARLRHEQPHNSEVEAVWQELLNTAGLDSIASKSIAQ